MIIRRIGSMGSWSIGPFTLTPLILVKDSESSYFICFYALQEDYDAVAPSSLAPEPQGSPYIFSQHGQKL